jgi:hypothetical protein
MSEGKVLETSEGKKNEAIKQARKLKKDHMMQKINIEDETKIETNYIKFDKNCLQ